MKTNKKTNDLFIQYTNDLLYCYVPHNNVSNSYASAYAIEPDTPMMLIITP